MQAGAAGDALSVSEGTRIMISDRNAKTPNGARAVSEALYRNRTTVCFDANQNEVRGAVITAT